MLRNTCEKAANGCEMLRTVFRSQDPIGLSRGKNYGIHSWAFILFQKDAKCCELRTATCERLRNVVFKSTHVQKILGDLSKLVSKPKSQISDLLPTFLAV